MAAKLTASSVRRRDVAQAAQEVRSPARAHPPPREAGRGARGARSSRRPGPAFLSAPSRRANRCQARPLETAVSTRYRRRRPGAVPSRAARGLQASRVASSARIASTGGALGLLPSDASAPAGASSFSDRTSGASSPRRRSTKGRQCLNPVGIDALSPSPTRRTASGAHGVDRALAFAFARATRQPARTLGRSRAFRRRARQRHDGRPGARGLRTGHQRVRPRPRHHPPRPHPRRRRAPRVRDRRRPRLRLRDSQGRRPRAPGTRAVDRRRTGHALGHHRGQHAVCST